MKKRNLGLILFLFLSTQMGICHAQSDQNIDAITQTVQNFVDDTLQQSGQAQNYKVLVGNIDPRLRLNACESYLDSFFPPRTRQIGNTTVGVRCNDKENSWTLYVPVQIQTFQNVVVTQNSLARGQIIQASDVTLVEMDSSQIRGPVFTNVNDVIGLKIKRNYMQNQIILGQQVCMVCKGEAVTIAAMSAQISIGMPGIALSDGVAGESVRVRNKSSNRDVQGIVQSSDLVQVAF